MTDNISETLRLHELWLANDSTGIRANLSGANLSGANLYSANLSSANLCGANLSDADLSGANLSGAILCGADLSGVNLSGAILCGANLSDADLSGANLYSANLCGANLSDANLRGANLCGAILYSANLRGANLRGVNLSDAILSGADLSGAKGLPIAADHLQRLRAVANEVLANPARLQMTAWHSDCGTTHCLAGWAIHHAGPIGKVLEQLHGPYMAGLLLLGVDAAEHFHDSNDDAINWLRSIAQEAA